MNYVIIWTIKGLCGLTFGVTCFNILVLFKKVGFRIIVIFSGLLFFVFICCMLAKGMKRYTCIYILCICTHSFVFNGSCWGREGDRGREREIFIFSLLSLYYTQGYLVLFAGCYFSWAAAAVMFIRV